VLLHVLYVLCQLLLQLLLLYCRCCRVQGCVLLG
jgi:hypothetical protein